MKLSEKIKRQIKGGVQLMEGREKGNIELDKVYTVMDFAFLVDKVTGEEYVAYTVAESEKEFFFGGSVITGKFKTISDCLSEEEIEQLKKEGLEVKFVSKKSERNRRYIDMEIL